MMKQSLFSIFTISAGVALWVLFQGQLLSMPLILIAIGGVDRILDKLKKSQSDDTSEIKEEIDMWTNAISVNLDELNKKLDDISLKLSQPSAPSAQIEQLAESVQGISQGMAYILPVVKKTQDLYKAQGL